MSGDRSNRVIVFTLGTLLAGAGVFGLVAGSVGSVDHPGTLYLRAREAVGDRPSLWLPLLFLAALATTLGGARLVAAELGLRRPAPPAPYRLDGGRGITRLEPRAIERALEADLRQLASVERSRARMTSLGDEPTVALSLKVAGSNLEEIRRRVGETCQRLRQVLGVGAVHSDLEVDLASGPGGSRPGGEAGRSRRVL